VHTLHGVHGVAGICTSVGAWQPRHRDRDDGRRGTMEILVTGGTGTLGRVVVERLRERGHVPRVLSRRAGAGRVVGDLETGAGVAEAVSGVDAVVHAASRPGHDVAQAETLLAALRAEGARRATGSAAAAGETGRHAAPHLVFVSIVGVDRVPLAYYRDKVEVERLTAAAGVPWTVLRATQFHDLLSTLFGVLGRSPVLPVLAGASFQPVDVRDVADRLAELATGTPAGRAPDLGGPQVRSMADLARTWAGATGRRRGVLPVRLPGGLARAVRDGGLLTPDHADGRITFEEFLAGQASYPAPENRRDSGR
jgi:uncharacterized protein YbjT (DUF2867 family)